MFKNDEALVAEEMRRTTEAAAVSEDTMFEEQASDDGPLLFFYYYFLKKCVLQRFFFYFWQNIVCFSFITVHTRYITIMCLQKETGKENIHESPKCIKLNRCKNK